MTHDERVTVRQSLLDCGFRQTSYTEDMSGRGDYIERWRHADGSMIRLEWGERQPDTKYASKEPT